MLTVNCSSQRRHACVNMAIFGCVRKKNIEPEVYCRGVALQHQHILLVVFTCTECCCLWELTFDLLYLFSQARNYISSLPHMPKRNFADVFIGANPLGNTRGGKKALLNISCIVLWCKSCFLFKFHLISLFFLWF